MKNVIELREQRAKLINDARELLNKAETESKDLTREDESRWDAMMSDADKLKGEIDRLERQADAEKSLEERIYKRAGRENIAPGEAEKRDEIESGAFRNWLKGGMSALTDEQRSHMLNRQSNLPSEARALATGTDAAGGYLIPEGFRRQLEEAMKAFGGMREAAFVFGTETGNPLPMPTVNDTTNKGAILAENTQVTEQDVTFGSLTLDAYTYTSKLIRVPFQLLQDNAFDLQAYLARALGERIARITNEHFTTGTGTSQPRGVVVASTAGKTGTTGQTTSIIYDDLVDLEHSVDPAYRRGAIFMANDSSIKVVKKLKDSDGRPLWVPGIAVREPDTILGYRYVVNQDVASMAANAKSVLFGDFSKYLIRDVLGITMVRLNERYADYLQVGFMAYSRHDGDLLDAGTNPIKHYANSAT